MHKVILLVEDNPTDEELTLRRLNKNRASQMRSLLRVMARRRSTICLRQGLMKGETRRSCQRCVLLDLKLPLIDGLEVLRRIRSDDRTRLLPVSILTASKEEEISSKVTRSARTPTYGNRSIS